MSILHFFTKSPESLLEEATLGSILKDGHIFQMEHNKNLQRWKEYFKEMGAWNYWCCPEQCQITPEQCHCSLGLKQYSMGVHDLGKSGSEPHFSERLPHWILAPSLRSYVTLGRLYNLFIPLCKMARKQSLPHRTVTEIKRVNTGKALETLSS